MNRTSKFLTPNGPEKTPGSPGPGDNPIRDLIPSSSSGQPGYDYFGPIWLGIIQTLKMKGLQAHLPQAIISVLTMVSAHVQQPLALFITPETGTNPIRFLTGASSLIPHELKFEASGLKRKDLEHNPSLLNGKAVISFEPGHLKTSRGILNLPLKRCVAQDYGPTSVVALADQPEPQWLRAFPALRLTLSISPNIIRTGLDSHLASDHDLNQLESLTNIMAKELLRLKPAAVHIPYLEQVIASLDQADPHLLAKVEQIRKLLAIITLINHATLASRGEMVGAYYGLDKWGETYPAPMTKNLSPSPLLRHGQMQAKGNLTATKIEYIMFWNIVGGIFAQVDSPLTTQQKQIFAAIQQINLSRLRNPTLLVDIDEESEPERLKILTNASWAWATAPQIREVVNSSGAVRLLEPIEPDLRHLVKQGLLVSRKDETLPGGFRYAVTTFTAIPVNRLPHPSEINDPVFQGREVTVWDPISGQDESF